MRVLPSLIVVAVAVGLLGCQSSAPDGRTAGGPLPSLEESVSSEAGLSSQEINDATKLYVVKCARCHKFYDPADYGENEWRSWMKKMSKKAVLKPGQEVLLFRYLGAFRASANAREK